MSPEQFLAQLDRQKPAPAYLFLGAEPYRRGLCRRALIEKVLPLEDREEGLTRHDLGETTLSAIADDARSLALFAPRRLIWVLHAEAALPRTRTAREDSHDRTGSRESAVAPLIEYLEDPTPEVVLVLEASRYELDGEDKAKAERVRKLYAAIPAQVEFPRFTIQEARVLARELARSAGLSIDRPELDLLVEAAGADAVRIAAEIEKLRLYAGGSKRIGAEDLATLVPDSSASTVFVLVDALGRGDRLRALDLLNTLVRQGEYLPLALSFLATLFRLALATKERGLRNAHQVQQQLSSPGRPIWRSRAEQILHTASVFSREQLETAMKRIYAADKALRDARPDDRIVMEAFILRLAD